MFFSNVSSTILAMVIVAALDIVSIPRLFWKPDPYRCPTPRRETDATGPNPKVVLVRGFFWLLWLAVSLFLIFNWAGMALALLVTHFVGTVVYCKFDGEYATVAWFTCLYCLAGLCALPQSYSPSATVSSVESYPLESYQYQEAFAYDGPHAILTRHVTLTYISSDGKHAGEVEVDDNHVHLAVDRENPRVEITTYTQTVVDRITIIPVPLREEVTLVETTFYLPDYDFVQTAPLPLPDE